MLVCEEKYTFAMYRFKTSTLSVLQVVSKLGRLSLARDLRAN